MGTKLYLLLVFFVVSIFGTRYEAEDGVLEGGVTFANSIPGYSGRGYVTDFSSGSSDVQLSFTNIQPGAYEIIVGYHTSFGEKGFNFQVDDDQGTGMFQATGGNNWARVSIGKFLLTSSNKVTIGAGWGYYEVDYIDVNPTTITPPIKPPKVLSDSNATPATKSLFSYLIDNFGVKMLSGNYDFPDIEYVINQTGKSPAVGGFDLMDYSPSRVEHGANATGQVESEISWALKGNGLVTLSWHWNAPCDLINTPGKEWWRGFYTFATTYDIAFALANQNSTEYKDLIRDLDAIAVQLVKFQDANTPLLWRPLHEAAGGWFWWGAKGPEPFKQLWRLMYDRYVNYHGLHHLIWVYVGFIGQENWFPGNDVVDIVSMDVYDATYSSMSAEWTGIEGDYNGKKLVGLSETGTLPVPDKVRGLGTWWSWFEVWGGFVQKQPVDLLRQVYSDADIITLDKLPNWRHWN